MSSRGVASSQIYSRSAGIPRRRPIDGTFDDENDFTGDIGEILVLRRLDDTDDTEPTMFTDSTTTSPDKLGSDPGGDDGPTGPQGDFEITRIEGYLAHK